MTTNYPEVKIAIVDLLQGDLHHMQLRSGKDQSGSLGKIGLFGGRIEDGELPEETACREIGEETNVLLTPDKLEFIAEVDVDSDMFDERIKVFVSIFRAMLDEDFMIKAEEGGLVSLTTHQAQADTLRMTPATRVYFERII